MRYIKPVLIICVLFLWVFLSASADYQWASKIIRNEVQEGWVVVHKQDNLSDLFSPWSLFKTPVTGIWFVNDTDIKNINSNIILVHVLRVSYNYSRTDREEYFNLVNAKTEESAFVGSGEDLKSLVEIKWDKPASGTPGAHIIQHVVNYQ